MIPLIYAHRGASRDAPENTMAAFRLAVEQGAQGIELDVQMTADGDLVVIHDETLERTTNGRGLVKDHTWTELAKLDASYRFPAYTGEPIPLLRDVLAFLAPTRLELNIELKNSILDYPGMEEQAIRLVRESGMDARVAFSSFNHYSMAKVTRLAPELETALLYDARLYEPWNYARAVGAGALHPEHYSVTPDIAAGARRAGIKLRPWTVDADEELRRMIALGVDAVITNVPSRMRALIAEEYR